MATLQLIAAQTVSGSYSSSSFSPDMVPDRYGHFIVTHSGSRLASSSNTIVVLQGSLDSGASWFDIETLRASDTDYVNNTTNSWIRIVPIVNQIRATVINGNNLTFNSWVLE